MLRILKTIIIVSIIAVISSCGSKANQENYNKVQDGMKKSEVISLLGEPTESASIGIGNFGGDNLVWKTKNSQINIQFINDKVVAKSWLKDSTNQQEGK